MKPWIAILPLLLSLTFAACSGPVVDDKKGLDPAKLGIADATKAEEQIKAIQTAMNMAVDWPLAIEPGEAPQKLTRLFVAGNGLYAVFALFEKGGDGSKPENAGFRLYAIDPVSGQPRWALAFDEDILYPPAFEAIGSKRSLYLVTGNSLAAIDITLNPRTRQEAGSLEWIVPVRRAVSTGVCVTSSSISVGTHIGRVCRVVKQTDDDRFVLASASAAGAITTTPIRVASNDRIYFVTGDRKLYFKDPGQIALSEPVTGVGPVRADPFLDRPTGTLYVASTNRTLYALTVTGNPVVLWQESFGSPLVDTPYPFNGTLLLRTENNELIRFDPTLRSERKPAVNWKASGVKQLLAVGLRYVYVITTDQKFARLDPGTGERVGEELDASELDVPLTHTGHPGKIFLASSTGQIWLLQER